MFLRVRGALQAGCTDTARRTTKTRAWRKNGPSPKSSFSSGCSARSTRAASPSKSSKARSGTRSRRARGPCGAISASSPTQASRGSSTASNGRYRFAEGYSLRRLNLSHRELLGLVTLKRLGSSLGGTFAAAIEETTEKLLRSSDRRAEVAVDAARRWRSASRPSRWTASSASSSSSRAPSASTGACSSTTPTRTACDAAPRRSVRLHRLQRAASIWSATTTPATTCASSRSTTSRRRDQPADVREAGRFQPRHVRRKLGQRRRGTADARRGDGALLAGRREGGGGASPSPATGASCDVTTAASTSPTASRPARDRSLLAGLGRGGGSRRAGSTRGAPRPRSRAGWRSATPSRNATPRRALDQRP
jgi:hypothetical protein